MISDFSAETSKTVAANLLPACSPVSTPVTFPVIGAVTAEAELAVEDAERMLADRDLECALDGFYRAEGNGADPDRCAAGRWMCFMLLGRLSDAWLESDAIRARGLPDIHRFWDGGSLPGKRVLVRCLHGFGDAVQFLRYVPWLHRQVAELTIEVAPAFAPLARCLDGAANITTWEQRSLPWDAQIEAMELPYIFRSTLNDLPGEIPYLRVPRELVKAAGATMQSSPAPQVGIAWTAGGWNPARSIPMDLLKPLLTQRDVALWSLHPGVTSGMHDGEITGRGLLPLAALIANLDLVISVDTLAAHLAGAMGKPVWLLLQYCADWRWMSGRVDSPWYPHMRIFRQRHQGGWSEVITSVREELLLWISRYNR